MVIVAARESENRKSGPKAADLMLRAKALRLNNALQKNLQQEQDLFRQVLALEPNNASAMVGFAGSLAVEASNFDSQMDECVTEKKWVEARDLALRAKELDPENPDVYFALGSYTRSYGDRAGALRALETRLSLEPKNPSAYNSLAVVFYFDGEPQKSIELLTQAINLDPKYPTPNVLGGMGRAYFMLGDNDAAIEWIQKCLETTPGWISWYEYALLAMAYANKGDDARARTAAGELRRLNPNIKLSEFVDKPDSASTAAYKKWFETKLVPAWRKAGLPE